MGEIDGERDKERGGRGGEGEKGERERPVETAARSRNTIAMTKAHSKQAARIITLSMYLCLL